MEDKAWLDYQARFAELYDDSTQSSFLQFAVTMAGHRLCEKPFSPTHHFPRVVEIGAGTGDHIAFVRHGFDEYVLTDLNPKTLEKAKQKIGSSPDKNILFQTQEADRLDYPDDAFDRLISSYVLEHIYQPHLALKEWSRVVKNGGVITILIPADPGLAWRLGRYFGPRRDARRQGFDYDYVMAREHVNPCNNLLAFIGHYFRERQEFWWPFRLPSIDLNLFYVCHAVNRKPLE